MFQAKMISAANYMFKAWANALAKKQIKIDPLQCCLEFKRNFPLDLLSEAQAVQALIGAGLPKRIAYQLALSGIDDIEYVMQLIQEEQDGIPALDAEIPEDMVTVTPEEQVQQEEQTEETE